MGVNHNIAHYLHMSHPLALKTDQQSYVCDGCRLLGAGARYRCDICDFDLHFQCAMCPREVSFIGHPQHNLTLFQPPEKSTSNPSVAIGCSVCLLVIEGLFFHCGVCKYSLHPVCLYSQLALAQLAQISASAAQGSQGAQQQISRGGSDANDQMTKLLLSFGKNMLLGSSGLDISGISGLFGG